MTPGFPSEPLSPEAGERLERATDRDFRLRAGETAADGVLRVIRGRAESAVDRLRREAADDQAKAIHDARKDLKKLRSVLRLARGGLGNKRYRAENARHRDAAALLSGARDAEVKLSTLAALRERYGAELPALEALQRALEAERVQAASAAVLLEEAARAIDAGLAEIDGWTLRDDGFDLLRPGLERAYRRGRDRFAAVREAPTDEAVHEWRKRVKDLWYQLRLLRDAWPEGLRGPIAEADRLADLLGDHHDLAVLVADAHERGRRDGAPATAVELTALDELARRRQDELLTEAMAIGRRLYAEKPGAFARRIAAYWDAWRAGAAG